MNIMGGTYTEWGRWKQDTHDLIQVGRIQFYDQHDRIFARPLGPLSSAGGSPAPMRYGRSRAPMPDRGNWISDNRWIE